MALPLTVKHYQFEPATSLLERLAIRNACPNTHIFCSEMGLSYDGVYSGKVAELQRLSELAGGNLDDLTRWSPMSCSADYYLLAGHQVSRHSLHRASSKICPVCISGDILDGQIPAQRVTWKIRPVTVCPVHLCYLIELPRSQVRQFGNRVDLCALGDSKPYGVREPPAFQTYVLQKLFSVPDKIWFEGLKISSLLSLCTALARCIERNFTKEAVTNDAIERAFSILKTGEASFSEALSRCLPAFSGRQEGYYKRLRPMIEWLRSDRRTGDLDPTCRTVAEVVHATCSVHRSSKLLEGVPRTDQNKTFHHSRGMVDVGGRQLEQFLTDRRLATIGTAPFSYPGTRYLTVGETLFAAQEIKEFGTVKAAAGVLKISVDACRVLIRSGLLHGKE